MNSTATILLRLACPSFLVASALPFASAQTIIDDDFDSGELSGWMSQGNVRLATHTISQAASILTSEVAATQRDTNRGIVSTTSFDANATGGFTMTFAADSVSDRPAANGYFIGLVRDNDVFHRDAGTRNFGLAFFGIDARTGSTDGFGLMYGDNNNAASADFQIANSDAQGDVDVDSFFDGFTATVSVDPAGWLYEITGLLDAALAERTFSDSGTWADAGTSFAELFPPGQEWFIMGALQISEIVTHTITFDRITLVGGAGGGADTFQILSVTPDDDMDDPNATITWTSAPNRSYSIDVSTDLTTWTEIEDGVPSGGETTTFVHHFLEGFPELVDAPRLYYQIRR